jgi:CDP-diacylglycerol--serine O-phosphatidyltransferase
VKPIKSVKLLPNIITAANLFCGFLSMILVARALGTPVPHGALAGSIEYIDYIDTVTGFLYHACQYILFAMVFDALDGKVARMVQGTSDFGAQLDSLCDAVSFCVAPAFLMYSTCRLMPQFPAWFPDGPEAFEAVYHEEYLFICAAIYVLCGVMRLARFNVETTSAEEDHQYFKGMPTPAAAAVMISFVALFFNLSIKANLDGVAPVILYALPLVSILAAVLMVTSVPYVHVVALFGRSKASFEILVVVVAIAVFSWINFFLTMFIAMLLYMLTGLFGLKGKFQKSKESDDEDDENEEEYVNEKSEN